MSGVEGSGFRVQERGHADRALLLTPPGGAAIAVVRLTGPGVDAFLKAHFSKRPAEGRCVHGELRDDGRVIDDPVVVLHPGGTVADVNLHGGPWVVRSMLELARRAGFEVVERVEPPLPEEAVDAETELRREVLRYLPMARTELAVRVLDALYWLLHPPRVAIVGAPNVGKSTLANRLFAQERSITADMPGTTRDWVGEIANVDGLAVMLVDTPGMRATDDPVEREAIERSRGQVEGADLVVLVLDATRDLPAQREMLASFPKAVRVVNKSDGRKTWDAPQSAEWLHTVATTGRGVEELREAIQRHFLGAEPFDVGRARWWTARQREALRHGAVIS
jgi:small GTP-binding protein